MGLESPRVWKVSKELTIVYWEDGAVTTVKPDGSMTLRGRLEDRYNNPSEEHKRAVRRVLEKSNE